MNRHPGQILIDGVDTATVSLAEPARAKSEWCRSMCYCSTPRVRDNIAYGRPEPSYAGGNRSGGRGSAGR